MIALTASVTRERTTGMGFIIVITPHVVGHADVTFCSFVLVASEENEALVTRLVQAIEAGVALTDVSIKPISGGGAFVSAKEEFSLRRLNADLTRLGF